MKHIIAILLVAVLVASCGGEKSPKEDVNTAVEEVKKEEVSADPMSNKGIGPISAVTLGEIDQEMVSRGETAFKAKCTACHKLSKRFIGPALNGVTQRRSPEWIMNMIMNPEEMVQKDPIASQLLIEYNGAPMANQSVPEEEARAILEYFRTKN